MQKRSGNRNGHAIHQADRVEQGRPPLRRPAALRALGEVVYAVRIGDVIKIGHTTQLQHRVNQLGVAEILAFAPGTFADEQVIHASLDGHQHHGVEWYYPTRAVLAVVNEMRETLGLEPIAA